MSGAARADYCVIACAEAWRDAGEILASPMGLIPSLGARLARHTFAPDLLLTDGEAMLVGPDGSVEGWLPYRRHLTLVTGGRRHVMMGASQIDRYGNQNISCVGDWARPRRQLLGVRGAPVNTLNNPTSYWVPRHSRRVFVERVDMVCGVGYDRAAGARFHHLARVVSDLGVFDFATPDHSMRLASLHPGVTEDQVTEATGFALTVPEEVPYTRAPTAEELRLIREVLDPEGSRLSEVPDPGEDTRRQETPDPARGSRPGEMPGPARGSSPGEMPAPATETGARPAPDPAKDPRTRAAADPADIPHPRATPDRRTR